jgi:hypothetical protein
MLKEDVKFIGHAEGQIVTMVNANILLACFSVFPLYFGKIAVRCSMFWTFSHCFYHKVTLGSPRLLSKPQNYFLIGHFVLVIKSPDIIWDYE